jgi:hypothetical protein
MSTKTVPDADFNRILMSMDKTQDQEASAEGDLIGRARTSRLLSELRNERRRAMGALDPGCKMMNTFLLSSEARKMFISGLQSQGFTELEISQIIRARRR